MEKMASKIMKSTLLFRSRILFCRFDHKMMGRIPVRLCRVYQYILINACGQVNSIPLKEIHSGSTRMTPDRQKTGK